MKLVILPSMGKQSKKRASAEDPALQYLPAFDARSQLVNSMLGVGWRLALTVLIPVFVGIWADDKFGTKPSLTLSALFIAIFASSMVIAKMYKELNERAKQLPTSKKKPKVIKGYDDEDDDY